MTTALLLFFCYFFHNNVLFYHKKMYNRRNLHFTQCLADRGELHQVAVVGQNTTLLQEIPVFTSEEPVNNILLHQVNILLVYLCTCLFRCRNNNFP